MPEESQSSLLTVFESFDGSIKASLADIRKPLLLSLGALALAEDRASRKYLSAEHIVAALEAAGVAVKKSAIVNALSRAGAQVSRKTIEGETHYRIMTQGRRNIEPLLGLGPIHVARIEGGKPRSARQNLAEILGSFKCTVRICDPYYGIRSLDAPSLMIACCFSVMALKI